MVEPPVVAHPGVPLRSNSVALIWIAVKLLAPPRHDEEDTPEAVQDTMDPTRYEPFTLGGYLAAQTERVRIHFRIKDDVPRKGTNDAVSCRMPLELTRVAYTFRGWFGHAPPRSRTYSKPGSTSHPWRASRGTRRSAWSRGTRMPTATTE